MREPRPYDDQLAFTQELVREVNLLREALLQLLHDPGQPHAAAARAREILDGEE